MSPAGLTGLEQTLVSRIRAKSLGLYKCRVYDETVSHILFETNIKRSVICMSNYAILRIEKVKNVGVMKQIDNHNKRRSCCYDNVDLSLSHYNSYVTYDENGILQSDVIEGKDLFEFYTKGVKYRKDAIKMIDGIMTKSEGVEDEQEWLDKCIEFLKKEFKGCPMNVQVHCDEPNSQLHIHFQVIPIQKNKDDEVKLNGSRWFGKKKDLSQLQDRYAEHMKCLGLERGVKKSNNHHKSLKTYYSEQEKQLRDEYEKKIQAIEKEYIDKLESLGLGGYNTINMQQLEVR